MYQQESGDTIHFPKDVICCILDTISKMLYCFRLILEKLTMLYTNSLFYAFRVRRVAPVCNSKSTSWCWSSSLEAQMRQNHFIHVCE